MRGRGAEGVKDGRSSLVAGGGGRHAGGSHQTVLHHAIQGTAHATDKVKMYQNGPFIYL